MLFWIVVDWQLNPHSALWSLPHTGMGRESERQREKNSWLKTGVKTVGKVKQGYMHKQSMIRN